MDGSSIDHSDSDSGDSWTILDHNPTYGDDAPDFAENNQTPEKDGINSNLDKDEDTDGISIISDSEPEIPSACELIQDLHMKEDSHPAEIPHSQFISFNHLPPNNDHEESIRSEDDFLGNNTVKHKTYVHRRNKRLSTVLNIIMLGSVITAAGVALGHMWGARNECSIHTTPSINKILSNLYKLQEENTYLRNKLKELTLINSLQMQHKKLNTAEKLPLKPQRCKKIYEEPLNSKNTERFTKCIDNEINNIDNSLDNHLIQPDYEKSFTSDVDKLKHIYQQNRSWLDEEVAKRTKYEDDNLKKKIKNSLSSIIEEQKVQDDSTKTQSDIKNDPLLLTISSTAEEIIQWQFDSENNTTDKPVLPAKKNSYADSLKSNQRQPKVQKKEEHSDVDKDYKNDMVKKKIRKNIDVTITETSISEEDFKKDDRYVGPKYKQEKKKRDRQKLHKKQKRRNKYEQWEMKGGYMKDSDSFSTTSIQDSKDNWRNADGNQLSQEFEKTHYINKIIETDSIQNINSNSMPKKNEKITKNSKGEDGNWYDKRAALRTEARKKLEHELFGETSPNNAGWYFCRMQKREQCRTKSDNSTYKKLYKRNMNFKTKQ